MVRQTHIPDPDEPGLKLWVTLHTCSRCGEEKLSDEFYLSPTNSSGYQNYCKSCQAEYKRQYRRQYARSSNNTNPVGLRKYCPKCGKTKSVSEFHRNKYNPDGYHNICKEDRSKKSRKSSEE